MGGLEDEVLPDGDVLFERQLEGDLHAGELGPLVRVGQSEGVFDLCPFLPPSVLAEAAGDVLSEGISVVGGLEGVCEGEGGEQEQHKYQIHLSRYVILKRGKTNM